MLWVKALGVWLVMLLAAFLNGALRELLIVRLVAEQLAHVLSVCLLSGAIFGITYAFVKALGPSSASMLLGLGLSCLVLSLLFEFGFFHIPTDLVVNCQAIDNAEVIFSRIWPRTSSKRHTGTGKGGVSRFHHRRPIGLSLNPVESGINSKVLVVLSMACVPQCRGTGTHQACSCNGAQQRNTDPPRMPSPGMRTREGRGALALGMTARLARLTMVPAGDTCSPARSARDRGVAGHLQPYDPSSDPCCTDSSLTRVDGFVKLTLLRRRRPESRGAPWAPVGSLRQ